MKEEFLELYLRKLRIRNIKRFLDNEDDILDIGCGRDATFLKTVSGRINTGIGIDIKANELESENLIVKKAAIHRELDFDDDSFDKVFMLAVLEHLPDPESLLKEINRVLRHQGRLIMTVPSKLAGPILEFLAFRLNVISRAEIMDHKKYYNRQSLKRLSKKTGFSMIYHNYFELYMNNLVVFEKSVK